MSLRKITIITVVLNAVDLIEDTILSVVNQTYPNIEYIIIDGSSTDGTIEILRKYEKFIARWLSEPDKGIYYAMNKGLKMATGEWINFMNAGDTFYNQEVIYDIFYNSDIIDADIIYGKTSFTFSTYSRIIVPSPLWKIKKNLPFCHQSSFVRTKLILEHPFDTSYIYVADDHFFYNRYKSGSKFKYVDHCISCYEAVGGLSSRNLRMALKENFQIRYGDNFYFIWRIQYFFLKLYFVLVKCLKVIIPQSVITEIYLLKNKVRQWKQDL
jgi:glycosyltransferase involved in cell wall biosynthesis